MKLYFTHNVKLFCSFSPLAGIRFYKRSLFPTDGMRRTCGWNWPSWLELTLESYCCILISKYANCGVVHTKHPLLIEKNKCGDDVIAMDINPFTFQVSLVCYSGARCSSVVRAFAHGAMGCRIDPSRGEPIELFLVPDSAPRLV